MQYYIYLHVILDTDITIYRIFSSFISTLQYSSTAVLTVVAVVVNLTPLIVDCTDSQYNCYFMVTFYYYTVLTCMLHLQCRNEY